MSWYAVRTSTRREPEGERSLRERGFTYYLPCETRWKHTPWKKTKVQPPLFPGYMFVRCDADDFPEITAMEGIHQFVRWMARTGELEPAPFPDMMVLGIQLAEAAGEFDHTRPTTPRYDPAVGDRVRITGSQWAGHMATILQLKPSERRVRLELDGMGKMTLDAAHLEAAA